MKYVLLLLLVACTSSGELVPPIILPDASTQIAPCIDTDSDMFNCGACGITCSQENTDQCSTGQCFCGNEPPCQDGFDCRLGRCVPVDLEGATCEFDDQCLVGEACIEGHCSVIDCVPEVCDNSDNDCDGFIDNIADMPLSQFCLGEEQVNPLTEEINPPCSFGVRVCVDGSWSECFGDNAPIPEQGLLACDGLDNDCDGCLDGVLDERNLCVVSTPSNFDVVYVVDISGSMSGFITAVDNATRMHSALYAGRPNFKFGLVTVGTPTLVPPYHELVQPLTDFITFTTSLSSLRALGGGIEPQWDAVTELGLETLPIGWRSDATRIIILFSDEPGQGDRSNEIGMCASFTHGEVLATFEHSSYFNDFDDCGMTFELTNDPLEMVNHLEMIISNPCD